MTESKAFEELISILLEAKHDIKINCNYDGEISSRQFDGYMEFHDPFNLITVKYGIECKKHSSDTPVTDIEGFITKLNSCKIDKGIFVIFEQNYQRSAILTAKANRIELLRFRKCVDKDLNNRLMKLIFHLDFKIPEYSCEDFVVTHPDIKKSTIPLDLSRENDYIYNDKGVVVTRLLDVLNNYVNLHRTSNSSKVTIPIDWTNYEYFLKIPHNNQITTVKIQSFTFLIQYKSIQEKVEIGENDPTQLFVLENVISKDVRFISRSGVDKILKKYQIAF